MLRMRENESGPRALGSWDLGNEMSPIEPGWFVQLAGRDADLEEWKRALKRPLELWIEEIPNGDNIIIALRSEKLNAARDYADARAHVQSILQVLGGVQKLVGLSPLNGQTLARIDRDGKLNFYPELNDELCVRDRFDIHPEKGNIVGILFEKAKKDNRFCELLIHIGRSDNFYDIYKSAEIIDKIFCGQHSVKNKLNQIKSGYGKQYSSWKSRLNDHRHWRGVKENSSCGEMITLRDARTFLLGVVRSLFL